MHSCRSKQDKLFGNADDQSRNHGTGPKAPIYRGSLIAKARKDGIDDQIGLVGPIYRNRHDTGLFRRVIISAWKQRISDLNHLFQ